MATSLEVEAYEWRAAAGVGGGMTACDVCDWA